MSRPPKVQFSMDSNLYRGGSAMKEESFRVGALTPYEALVAGGDKTKEVLLRRSKGNVDKILADIVREMLQQKLASIHFEAISNYVLFFPTMMVTFISAALSIFSTSDIVTRPELKTELTITVALLQLLLSILQSLSKQLDYGAKAGFHRSAARTLQKIHANAKHAEYESRYQSMFKALKENKRISIGFNVLGDIPDLSDSSHSSHSSHSSDDDSDSGKIKQRDSKAKPLKMKSNRSARSARSTRSTQSDDGTGKKKGGKEKKHMAESDGLGKQYKQAIEQVESIVPVRIANAFNVLECRIRVLNESLMTNKANSLVAWEQVLPALYYQLSETIIEWAGWPLFIPAPSDAVERTLADFKESLNTEKDNNADLLMALLDRSTDIFTVQERLEKKRDQKKKRQTISLTEQLKDAMKELGMDDEISFEHYHSESDALLGHTSATSMV